MPAHAGWINEFVVMPPPLIGGGALSYDAVWRLSVCPSVAYIGPKSRTERPRKTKLGTEVAHVTCVTDTTFKVKRSKVKVIRPLCSPLCWRVRRLQRWAWERVGRGKLLLHCHLLGGAMRFGAHGKGEERGHIVAVQDFPQARFPSNQPNRQRKALKEYDELQWIKALVRR